MGHISDASRVGLGGYVSGLVGIMFFFFFYLFTLAVVYAFIKATNYKTNISNIQILHIISRDSTVPDKKVLWKRK